MAGRNDAFSYRKSSVDNVIDYIKNQEFHHRKKHLLKSIMNFWKNLRLILMSGIF
jgi:hypothetical protein